MGSVETVERELQRAELAALLESKEFIRAPKLARLLSYLCEKYFAGEANQIKEYSIALEVFQRRESFDQDSDSIVRVEANRLRKRLAEYYAGEGASHPLHITIPVGQYVPRFDAGVPAPVVGNHFQTPAVQVADAIADSSAGVATQQKGRRTNLWWIVGITSLLLLGFGFAYSWMRVRRQKDLAPAATAIEIQSQRPDSLIGPPVGQEIRILAGSSRSLVDHAGKLWSADYGFTGGAAIKSSIPHIARTQDPWFYRASRQGEFRYDIPLPKGIYELRLHFAETVFGPESGGAGGEGSRIMRIRANGKTLINDFDIVADAGASLAADTKVFSDITPAADGLLHLEFAGKKESKPRFPQSKSCRDFKAACARSAFWRGKRPTTPMTAIGGVRITTSKVDSSLRMRRLLPGPMIRSCSSRSDGATFPTPSQ